MISVGAKSEPQAYGELKFAMNFLAGKGFVGRTSSNPVTQNIVVTGDFGKVLLWKLFAKH